MAAAQRAAATDGPGPDLGSGPDPGPGTFRIIDKKGYAGGLFRFHLRLFPLIFLRLRFPMIIVTKTCDFYCFLHDFWRCGRIFPMSRFFEI